MEVRHPETRLKYFTTAAIYFGNICLGISMNAYSPAVVDFSNKFGTEVDSVAVVFTIMTVSHMVGALFSTILFKYIRRQLGVIFFLLGMGLALTLAPHCPTLLTLYLLTPLLGVCNGGYDASQIVWVMEMWQAESGPFIQAQHFCYAIGSLIPPLLMAQFLSDEEEDDTSESEPNPSMWVPFTVVGIIVFAAALTQTYMHTFKRYFPPPPEEGRGKQGTNEKDVYSDKGEELAQKYLKWKLVGLSVVFLGFYQGMEICNMQFMSTFAQFGEHGMSEADGAYVLTGVTGSFAVGRALGIVAILKISAHWILSFNILMLLIGNTALFVFSDSSVIMIWIGAGLIGIGFSTVYPSFCAHMERHLLFTNAIGALITVSGSLVAAVYPLIIGNQIKNNAQVLLYVNYVSIACVTIAFLVIMRYTYKRN